MRGAEMASGSKDKQELITVEITPSMRGNLTPADIWGLPAPEKTAMLNGLTDYVGLKALVGDVEANRMWNERTAAAARALQSTCGFPPAQSGMFLFPVRRCALPFDLRWWLIRGRRVFFVGQVAVPEAVEGMTVFDEPEDDGVYCSVALHPSLTSGTLMGWASGAYIKKYTMPS
jgi:hypothetical protein